MNKSGHNLEAELKLHQQSFKQKKKAELDLGFQESIARSSSVNLL